jgi:cobalt-zinc-cadmium efflux system outer membrane protein
VLLLLWAVIVTLAEFAGDQAPQPAPSTRLTLQAALAAADAHNRTLVAARLGRAVDQAGIGVAQERPNPEFSFEAARDTPHENFTLNVPLELGGKRARRIEFANATLAKTNADLEVQALEVRRQVRIAYFELVAAATRTRVTTELRGLSERTREAARDRYESGAAPQLEVLQADLALAQASNDEQAATGKLAAARIELGTLIGQPLTAAIDPVETFDGGAVPADLTAAIASRPDIVALDRAIDAAVASERLARALRVPDPTVSGGLLTDAAPDFNVGWRAGFAITLPVFTRHDAAVQVETARVLQLRAEREARVAILTGEASAAGARADAARQQYVRYRDQIIPQLSTIESMAELSYRSGQTGLAAYLQALQSAREVRLRAADAGIEYQTALADLERAIGGPIQ